MKQELLDKLKQDFPLLFSQTHNMFVRDGWYTIIYAFCDIIHSHIEYFPEEIRNQVYITTLKEKFGTLRIHLSHQDDFMDGAITMAEYLSCNICELCSAKAPGQCNIGNYVQTLCDEHKAQETAAYHKRMEEYNAEQKKKKK